MSRSTDASLVCADQCPSPKSRVSRSAAATRTAVIAAASAGLAGVIRTERISLPKGKGKRIRVVGRFICRSCAIE
jgi:hypothetical protein